MYDIYVLHILIHLKLIYYFILILFASQYVMAQDPYAIKITSKDSNTSDQIYDVLQDSKGFVWTATSKGLFKYDGASFVAFKSAEQNTFSGSSIQEDKYGRIWYENFDGYVFYIENNELKKLNQNTPVGFVPYGITDRFLYIVQTKGVDIFDIATLKHIRTLPIDFAVAEHGCAIKNSYYFIADDILYKIDNNLKISTTKYFTNKKLHVKYIYPKEEGFYIVSKLNESETIYYFNEDLRLTSTSSLSDIKYIQGSSVIGNKLWIYTPKGAYEYEFVGNKTLKNHYFQQLSVSKIIKDDNQNYWFSSTNNGLHIVPNLNDVVHKILGEEITSFAQYDKGFLIGTQSGNLFSSDEQFSNIVKQHEIKQNLPTYYIHHDFVSHNTFFSNNGFNYATNNQFSSAINFTIALKEVVRIDDSYYAFASSNFCGLLKNTSSKNKSSYWDECFETNKDSSYKEIALLIHNKRAKSVSYDPIHKNIYFATNTGLFVYTDKGYKEIKHHNQSIFATKVLYANQKNYVLTTQGNLFELDATHRLIQRNEKFKIADQSVQLIKNINDHLYILTTKNLILVDGRFYHIIHHNFNSYSIKDFLIINKQLMVVTGEGIVSSDLNNSSKTFTCKPFVIEKVIVDNNTISWETPFKVPLDKNHLIVYFSILDYISNTTEIQYRINKGSWISINENVRQLEFPSLAAGNYELEFKIDEQLHPEKIYWEVQLPFWKTWWFYFLIFLVGITSIYFVYRWQYRMMNSQIKLLNEKIDLEKDLSQSILTSIKSQMNPHFFYNALNTIQAYIFTNEKKKANDYLAKFSKLTRMILEMSERERISLQEEIQSITLYLELENMRFSKDFTYEISYDEQLIYEGIEFPPMLLQPYIENSIKHGLLHSKKEKHLKITLTQESNYLIVEIDDNGIGRAKAEELNAMKKRMHQSFSTKANQKRLDILNKGLDEKITVKYIDKQENGLPTGTTVVLTIPIN